MMIMNTYRDYSLFLLSVFILACEPESAMEEDLCPDSQFIECGPYQMIVTTIDENECELLTCSEAMAPECPQLRCEWPNYKVETELDENNCEVPICERDTFHDEACGSYVELAEADYVCAQENLVPAFESCDQIECITVINTHPLLGGRRDHLY